MVIYLTGDTHIPYDIRKLSVKKFPQQKKLTKDDYIIISGDFGGIWNNGEEELYWRKWLNERPFTTLFIDGNHENFDLLNNAFDVTYWNGGKIHKINDSIIHLMRGQVYNIEGMKIFTMGGGESVDRESRTLGKTWWKEELPSESEYCEARENLEKVNWKVDYIITHTASMEMMVKMEELKENNSLTCFLNELESKISFRHWYFGHFHRDEMVDEAHTVVYQKIILLKRD